ncbi:hypothetical protein ACFY71_28355 [Streptomyces cinerochromogenes]|uniref:Uncharacterized protein n=1 Tax=Streptomyces cinerochromogenes TaxID=66422 RepID=A0ABW7B0U8_9ACTN
MPAQSHLRQRLAPLLPVSGGAPHDVDPSGIPNPCFPREPGETA